MDNLNKKLLLAGSAILLFTAQVFFNIGYNNGREYQKEKDLQDKAIRDYQRSILDKGVYWERASLDTCKILPKL
jgi:hypothetical protein